jgi:hypothetical protein
MECKAISTLNYAEKQYSLEELQLGYYCFAAVSAGES